MAWMREVSVGMILLFRNETVARYSLRTLVQRLLLWLFTSGATFCHALRSLGCPRVMQWEKTGVRRGLDSYPIVVMVTLGLSFPRVVWPKWKPLKYPLTDE